MKKSELKKVLKPLIKECIKECIFEEGVLSGIIKEVAQGIGGSVVVESKKKGPDPIMLKAKEDQLEKQRQEKIRRLNESTNLKGVFENTKPIQDGPTDNSDSGVDISGILNIAQDSWKHHLGKENV
jgi:hypothetical protein